VSPGLEPEAAQVLNPLSSDEKQVKRQKSKVKNRTSREDSTLKSQGGSPKAAQFLFLIFDFYLLPFDF
jgi:hypothetical protein